MEKHYFLNKHVLGGCLGIGFFIIPFLYGLIYTLSITKAPAYVIMAMIPFLSVKGMMTVLAGLIVYRIIQGIIIIMETRNLKSLQIAKMGIVVSKIPVSLKTYRIYLLLPGLLLGILPNILVHICKISGILLPFGILFTIASLGDFIYLWMTRSIKEGMILMKPENNGFTLVCQKEHDHIHNHKIHAVEKSKY